MSSVQVSSPSHRGAGHATRKRLGAVEWTPELARLTRLHPAFWLYAFVLMEMFCQVALVLPAFEQFHVIVRTAAFAGSFFFTLFMRASPYRHPVKTLAIVAVLICGVSILHPTTDGIWAGFASAILHLAIIGPVFWGPSVRIDVGTVRRLFLLLWVFHTASAVVGALQVYFPDRFPAALGSALTDRDIEQTTIILADGTSILRPSGLTGAPGGASISAVYCVLIGLGFLTSRTQLWLRSMIVGSMVLALVTLYLCQIRSLFIMLGVSVLSLAIPLAMQGRLDRFLRLVGVFVGVGVLGTIMAFSVGGTSTIDRYSTLIADDPTNVYYTNRGRFMESTLFELLPQYPLGAGLGRWGMIHQYFTDRLTSLTPLWVEIQWTAWLFDGGAILMIIYPAAVLVTGWMALKIARGKYENSEELKRWAAIAFAHGVGALVLTFNAPVFESNLGMDYWLLNAALFAAAMQERDAGVDGAGSV